MGTLTHRDLHAILAGYLLPATYQATIETDTGPDPEGADTMTMDELRYWHDHVKSLCRITPSTAQRWIDDTLPRHKIELAYIENLLNR
jgi:hypothetical protein